MYFTLKVNETVENAIMQAAELKAEIGKIKASMGKDEVLRSSTDETELIELDEAVCAIICRLGKMAGLAFAVIANQEVSNTIKSYTNTLNDDNRD